MTTPIEEVHRAAAIDSATTVTIVQNVANAVKNVPVQRWAMMRGARTAPVLRLVIIFFSRICLNCFRAVVLIVDKIEIVVYWLQFFRYLFVILVNNSDQTINLSFVFQKNTKTFFSFLAFFFFFFRNKIVLDRRDGKYFNFNTITIISQ